MERPIRIVIINGSMRKGNYTAMASALVADELRKAHRTRRRPHVGPLKRCRRVPLCAFSQ